MAVTFIFKAVGKQFTAMVLFCVFILPYKALAQNVDLFKMQDEQDKKEAKEKTDITTSIFKTTRLVNGQTIENTGQGVLDVKISHRFGTVNTGSYNFYGLDQATMRIGLDYGVTNRLEIGIGRSTYNKEFDGFFKYRILRQSTGKINMPLSVSWVSTGIWRSLHDQPEPYTLNSSDHFYFANQVILARKFNDYFSLQLVPTMVHYNIVPTQYIKNDFLSTGIGFRGRISKRVNLTGEYYYQLNRYPGTYNSLSLGVNIETGGHVFQFFLTNSTGINESSFITQTNGQWEKGYIHFGFNISRVFTMVKPKSTIKN